MHRRRLQTDLIKETDIHTPCGKLPIPIRLPMKCGALLTWMVVNPFAFLYHLCYSNAAYASLVSEVVAKSGKVSLYSDETTPGNVLHPDSSNIRKVHCIY